MLQRKLAFTAPERVYFRMRLKTALLVVLPVLAGGGCAAVGPFDEPYALFETGLRSAVRKELPVIINSVDGKYYRDPRRPGPFKPGKHVLEVHFTTALGPSWKHRKTVEIDADPCSRYRIVARYDNLTHVEWTPVIYPEPIGECVARFAAGARRTAG